MILLVSGQKWREFKITARRNSWAVEHRNQFPVPPAESDEEDEDTSWADYTTDNMERLSPWSGAKSRGLGLLLSMLYNFHVVCRRNLSEKDDFCYFEIRSFLISSQRKNTNFVSARQCRWSQKIPTPWRERFGARSKWTQMLCNSVYEPSRPWDWSLFTWVEKGTVRVNCPVQEHSALCPPPGLEPGVARATSNDEAAASLSNALPRSYSVKTYGNKDYECPSVV